MSGSRESSSNGWWQKINPVVAVMTGVLLLMIVVVLSKGGKQTESGEEGVDNADRDGGVGDLLGVAAPDLRELKRYDIYHGDGFELNVYECQQGPIHRDPRRFSKGGLTDEEYTVVTLLITNTGDRRIVKFRDLGFATMEDDVGNPIDPVEFQYDWSFSLMRVEVLHKTGEISPGESVLHAVVFEAAAPKTQHLSLTIPLHQFQVAGEEQEGKVRFKLPYNPKGNVSATEKKKIQEAQERHAFNKLTE